MKQVKIFAYSYNFIVGFVCLLLKFLPNFSERLIISWLLMACILGANLWLSLLNKANAVCYLLHFAAFVLAVYYANTLFAFICVQFILFFSRIAQTGTSFLLSLVASLIYGLVFSVSVQDYLFASCCILPVIFIYRQAYRLSLAHNVQDNLAEELLEMRIKLASLRKAYTTSDKEARIAERNRISARIHDKVGHGISGSILLLEGALLHIDKSPQKAKEALQLASSNLRLSVDEIRAELREERTNPGDAGLAKIEAMLATFQEANKNIQTDIIINGNVADILPHIWYCVQENLAETFTNILKHSTASVFKIILTAHNKLFKVSFIDNGKAGEFKQGIGLSAMQERCAACHGNCFFSAAKMVFKRL
jgi:signal transduction histidine kinase